MGELTGMGVAAWSLVFAYGVAVALMTTSRRPAEPGARLAGLLVVPFLTGAVLAAALLVVFPAASWSIGATVVSSPVAAAAVVPVFVLSLAAVDLALGRVLGLARSLLGRVMPARGGTVALTGVALSAAITTAVGAGFLASDLMGTGDRLPEGVTEFELNDAGWQLLGARQLPGAPLDITRGARGTFASLADGRLVAVDEVDLTVRTLWEGLSYPRGLALVDDVLLVAELGPLPCDPPYPWCTGSQVDEDSPAHGEVEIIESSEGRVRAFEVQQDGSLQDLGSVLDGLPVANTMHGLNGMVYGPDGLVYLAIGNVDLLWDRPDLVAGLQHPRRDLLGTIVRFRADGAGLEVFALGVRNVFGLAFDPAGRLYGVDNDGETLAGWRTEEVLHIVEGGHYGYPSEGSFGSYSRRTEPPLWVLPSKGSSGVLWDDGGSDEGGLLIGSCDKLERLGLREANGHPTVFGRSDEQVVATLAGCVVGIAETGEGNLLLAVYAYDEQRHALYIIDRSQE